MTNTPKSEKPLRILLLEDSLPDKELVIEALRGSGIDCDVECVTDKAGFEQALERGQFDVILSDFTMPAYDGLTALSQAQAKRPQVPFLFVSGTIGEERAVESLKQGATDFVLKKHLKRLGPAVLRALQVTVERARRLQAEERFRALVEQSLVGIYVIQDDRFVYVNPKMPEIFGLSSEELYARPVCDFVLPEDRELVLANIQKRVEGVVKSIHYNVRILHGTGELCYVEVHGSRIEYEGRAAVMGTMLDVTERERAEEALRQVEEKYRGIFENAVEGILQTTPDGRIVTANPAFARMLGYESAAALLAASLSMSRDVYVSPQNRIDYLQMMEERDVCVDFQCQLKRKDGQAIWVSFNARPVRDAAGTIHFYDAACADITQRLETEQRLREQATLLNLTSDAIIVHDLSHRVTYWNKGAADLYGWTAGEAVGQAVTELYAANPWEGREAARKHLLEQGGWLGELHQRTKTGRDLVVHSRWTLLRSGAGTPQAILSISSDITEKKRIEAQMLRNQRMDSIGSLAGGIAHDLNNALAPILMAANLMREQYPDETKLIDIVESSAKRGAGMVKQILTFARGSQGERGIVQLRHLINEIIDIARHTFPKAIQLRTNVATETWMLMGNPTQLHQILVNLCVNARDALPKGGTITLATGNIRLDKTCVEISPDAKPGPYVVLTVKDTGTGIPPEVCARIFDPFFTTKAPDKGTGLGLSTVHNIVKDHGGFLTVDSKVGEGTEFKAYLPAQPDAVAAVAEGEHPALPMGHGELILVVDDEAAIRSIVTQTLQSFGYRVVTANDGAHAVAVCAQQMRGLRLVITDMAMPIMDGKATISAIRTILPRLPIIAGSGSDSLAGSSLQTELDVQGSLCKPYSTEDLLHTIHKVLNDQPVSTSSARNWR